MVSFVGVSDSQGVHDLHRETGTAGAHGATWNGTIGAFGSPLGEHWASCTAHCHHLQVTERWAGAALLSCLPLPRWGINELFHVRAFVAPVLPGCRAASDVTRTSMETEAIGSRMVFGVEPIPTVPTGFYAMPPHFFVVSFRLSSCHQPCPREKQLCVPASSCCRDAPEPPEGNSKDLGQICRYLSGLCRSGRFSALLLLVVSSQLGLGPPARCGCHHCRSR